MISLCIEQLIDCQFKFLLSSPPPSRIVLGLKEMYIAGVGRRSEGELVVLDNTSMVSATNIFGTSSGSCMVTAVQEKNVALFLTLCQE